MLSMKRKMFHMLLSILLCVMLLAGAVMPAVLAVTHAEGGDDLLESTGLTVGLADTSLDSPQEITFKDDAGWRTVVNAVYSPPVLLVDSTNNTVGNPIELTFTDDEEWRNAVNEVMANDSALASEDYTLEAGKLTIDASVFTAPGVYTIVVKATGYEDATVSQTLTTSDFVVEDGVLVEYTGAGGDVVIPGDLGITSIGKRAFYLNEDLTSVVIPEGVTSIGTRAFCACENLTMVTIPNSVAEIGDWSFANCGSLASITIPNGVAEIGECAFAYCGSLVSITIPRSVTTIGSDVFISSPNVTIYGYSVSTAETYANENDIPFVDLERKPHIVSITPVDGVEVAIGTAEAEAITKLASETTIMDSNGETHTVVFEWTIANYDGNTAGNYTATGTFELPEGVEQSDPPKELKITVIVTVRLGGQEPVPVIGVSISEGDQVLLAGETIQLTAVVEPEDATDKSVTWSSSDEKVATVDETGLVTAKAKGTAAITVTTVDGNHEDSITVTVQQSGSGSVPVTGVSITEGDQMLKKNETVQLTAVVEPEDATDKSVTWSSSNEAVATVSETGLVTAKGDGEAEITVTTTDGNFTGSIKVVVSPYITITGDGVGNTKGFFMAELLKWKTERPDDWVGPRIYSTINTWPSKKWYAAEGVKLAALLEEAQIKGSARLIRVKSVDGYVMTFTKKELLDDTRYYFPNFKEGGGDGDGHIPGSPNGAEPVDAIIALRSVENSVNFGYMSPLACPLMVLGQRAVTEQTNHTFVKNVAEIEVSCDSPQRWAAPKAEPAGGEVPAGTEVKLTNEYNDADKIYYTTDGSDPSLESPIYNWVASRWWSQRGMDTVAEINHPIPLPEGTTTIKAKTIGFGREDSEIVTFTYKVIPKKTSESSEIKPDEGGTVSLDDEAVLEIPPGALTGTGAQEVKIERVESPPALPSGFKLLSDVFEFTIDGKKSYNFNKKVTITLSFDPKAIGKDETPSIHRYDEELGQWINLGGEISEKDNTISVEVDHFSKFAVMGALPSSVTATIKPGEGGTVSLGNEAAIEIPVGALGGNKAVEVKIERVESPPAAPIGFRLLSDVFEFSIDGKKSYNFAKEVTITLSLDPKAVGKEETPSIHCFDEELAQWENLGGKVSGSTISVEVDHFTKFAVMVELPSSVTALIEPSEGGTVSLGNEVSIEIPPGALTGSEAVEVKIERVKSPPVAPSGFKLLGEVFEITIDGKKSYCFAEEVTIKLGFDPKAATDVEANPRIHYYDEQLRRWVNLGGEISGHTVTVQVDHFTKFALFGKIKLSLTDIAGHWAESNIKELVSLGAISGYPDGTFRPNNNITRAEFVTVLVKAFQIEGQGGKVFVDTAMHWARDSIDVAAASGIAGGYDGDTFRPDELITREQMAAMIVRAAILTPLGEELAFTDSGSISGWAADAVAAAIKSGIMKGYPDNTFRPRGNATRAEAVTAIMNALPEHVKPSN